MIEEILCVARRQMRSIVDLCEQFGDRCKVKNLPIRTIFSFFDNSCQNGVIPLHREPIKNDAMMDVIISVGVVVAKCVAIAVMMIACGAIYVIESNRSIDNAL